MSIFTLAAFAALSLFPADGRVVDDGTLAGWIRASFELDAGRRPLSAEELLRLSGLRPDLEVARDVSAAVTAATADLDGLFVGSQAGVVTLGGRLGNEAARAPALAAARGVASVRDVVDRLALEGQTLPPAPVPVADDRREPFDFLLPGALAGRDLELDVAGGVVTLRGEVNSSKSRLYSLAAAQRIPGVRAVRDGLSVRAGSATSDARLAEIVRFRLFAHAELRPLLGNHFTRSAFEHPVPDLVQLDLVDGIVTLTGTVPSGRAKVLAEAIAAETPGVFAVEGLLTVDGDVAPPWREVIVDDLYFY